METLQNNHSSREKSQLKTLIAKGKEQGFLTYHEVNDHLPDDIVDPEQVEDIINMINDMGIKVHEVAPDLDGVILADDVDDEAAEEAAAALAAVESEFGRTTDPVRMYMREMGTVDLLTREGEIEIAKRIEEGLGEVLSSLADFPGVVDLFIAEYEKTDTEEVKISDIISGFVDPNADDDVAPAAASANDSDSSDDDDAANNNLDPEEVAERFDEFKKLNKKLLAAIKRNGREHKRSLELRSQLQEKFLEFKLVPKMTDTLIAEVKSVVDNIRAGEREILDLCVKQCKMPRKEFLSVFVDSEADPSWLRSVTRQKKTLCRSDQNAATRNHSDSESPR